MQEGLSEFPDHADHPVRPTNNMDDDDGDGNSDDDKDHRDEGLPPVAARRVSSHGLIPGGRVTTCYSGPPAARQAWQRRRPLLAHTDEPLSQFIHDGPGRGIPREQLTEVLMQAGWNESQVTGALNSYTDTDFAIPVPHPRLYHSAREAFVCLVLFSNLLISTLALCILLFSIINQYSPDVIGILYAGGNNLVIRWSISVLVVSFPVFLLVARVTHRTVKKEPAKSGSPVRRWLTYLTLFIAASALLCDFSVLVFYLLGGGTTTRFVLKTVVVAALSGAILKYYLTDLKQDETTA